jgi:hypothetical protein
MVFQSLRCADVEKHRIIERLRQLDARVFSARSGSQYNGTMSWLDNVRTEHAKSPFRAVVSPAVLSADADFLPADVDEGHDRWCTPQGCFIAREPEAFAAALRLLIAASHHIAFVDPYFRADQGEKTAMLLGFCELVAKRSGVVFDVHASEAKFSFAEQRRHAERALPQALPTGLSVTIRSWRERDRGERFHNRYLLTNVGGVQFGDGIERGGTGQHDRVSILSEADRAHLWSQFYGDALAFDLAGSPIVVAKR